MLSQGIVRAGTANSDSHSLALGQVGYPRNLVFTDPKQGGFDLERFDEDIRRGHMVGTNGPVLDVTIEDNGAVYRPGLDPITVMPDISPGAQLVVKISAAPWIPVNEVRVIVNGVAKTLVADPPEFSNVNHLGTQIVSTTISTPLASLLKPGLGNPPVDAWLIVEAGTDLPDAVDTDGDGLPDLPDPASPNLVLSDYSGDRSGRLASRVLEPVPDRRRRRRLAAARARPVNVRAAIVLLALLISTRAGAAPDACPGRNDPATGPLAGGIGPADFGAVPEACGATDAALRLRVALLVASTRPDYYGSVIGTTTLRGRYQLGARSTLSVAADVLDYRYVNNGGLASKGVSAGPATVAFHQMFVLGAATATSLYARVLLPLDTARENGVATGLELGGAIRTGAGSRVVIDGGLALAAPADIVAGQTHLRLQPSALGGGVGAPRPLGRAGGWGGRAGRRRARARPHHGSAPGGGPLRAPAALVGRVFARISGGGTRSDRPGGGAIRRFHPQLIPHQRKLAQTGEIDILPRLACPRSR